MSVDYVICNDFGISFIEIYASLMATTRLYGIVNIAIKNSLELY